VYFDLSQLVTTFLATQLSSFQAMVLLALRRKARVTIRERHDTNDVSLDLKHSQEVPWILESNDRHV